MKDFKFFRNNDNNLLSFNQRFTTLTQRRYENVEFCFQFDEDEPIVFANGSEQLNIIIHPVEDGNITFTNGDKKFTIFARETE